MSAGRPKLEVAFYRRPGGTEPVRAWLRALPKPERQVIGREIRTVQFGWPVGMPVVRKLENRLWEVRVTLDRRIARVLFTLVDSKAVLLHAFIKKSQRITGSDLALARRRERLTRES